MPTILPIKKVPLVSSAYSTDIFTKSQIYLHHTAGLGYTETVVQTWTVRGGIVGTAFVIEQDGTIGQVFDDKYWSNHASAGHAVHQISIGIELISFGPLEPTGQFQGSKQRYKIGGYSPPIYHYFDDSEIYTYISPIRGYKIYNKYTDAQLDSLHKLLCALCDKYPNVSRTNGLQSAPDFLYNPTDTIKLKTPGIWTHTNTVPPDGGKWDCHPQPELLSLLNDLSSCSNAYTLPDYSSLPVGANLTGPNKVKSAASVNKIPGNTSSSNSGGQNATRSDGKNTSEPAGTSSERVVDFNATFRQIERNIKNIELDQVDVTWGRRAYMNEDSDWIGLRQFIVYLATRFLPQTLVPFVELIPSYLMDEPTGAEFSTNDQAGNIPANMQNLADDKRKKTTVVAQKGQDLKFSSAPPPGYDLKKYKEGVATTNKFSSNTDLINVDPFQEEFTSFYNLSDSGKELRKERGVGARVYGQLVLSPKSLDGISSKPGAIGFTNLEMKQGVPSDNGLSLLSLTLLDVQGNKFTDVNSPWAFIFNSRPGSISGDFWFRYGWQFRVPDPNDKDDAISKLYWDHPGWLVFGNAREKIMENVASGRQTLTLSHLSDFYNMFSSEREDVAFNQDTGVVTVNRTLLDTYYTKVSLLPPDMEVDPKTGAVKAVVKFRTAAALASLCAAYTAKATKAFISQINETNLADLLIIVMHDIETYSILPVDDPELKNKRTKEIGKLNKKTKSYLTYNQDALNSLVRVIGMGKGGNRKSVDPTLVKIKISRNLKKQVTTEPDASIKNKNDITLIGWLRKVLQENDCELLSAVEGSGAGVNAAFVVATTQDLSNAESKLNKTQDLGKTNQPINFEMFPDVFAYRFQGSLVEELKVSRVDKPNGLKIETDTAVGDFLDYGADSQQTKNPTKVTAIDRKRNLEYLFALMQNLEVTCIGHPWIACGVPIYIKGLGFWDGEYQVLEVSHQIDNGKFTSTIKAARILITDDTEKDSQAKVYGIASGNHNLAEPVHTQLETRSTNKKPGGGGRSTSDTIDTSNSSFQSPPIPRQQDNTANNIFIIPR
jgi:hypothetical protein